MISKEQLVKGNQFVVNEKIIESQYIWDKIDWDKTGLVCYSTDNDKQKDKYLTPSKHDSIIPSGTIITIERKNPYSVSFKIEGSDIIYKGEWSTMRFKLDKIEGVNIIEPDEIIRYKIFYQGEPLKQKYFNDLGKVKSSLLIEFGYYQNQYEMFQKYKQVNPEIEDNEIPYWFESGQNIDREDSKNIEIRSFIKGKKDKVGTKVDFDVVKYFDNSMKLIDITAKFGNAAREMYKKALETKEYEYILVYIPDEYRDPKNFNTNHYYISNFDFSKLKESDRIKTLIKNSKLKVKKCTKFGKTAILLKNIDELKSFVFKMNNDEYIILDCNGDELQKLNNRYVKLSTIVNDLD